MFCEKLKNWGHLIRGGEYFVVCMGKLAVCAYAHTMLDTYTCAMFHWLAWYEVICVCVHMEFVGMCACICVTVCTYTYIHARVYGFTVYTHIYIHVCMYGVSRLCLFTKTWVFGLCFYNRVLKVVFVKLYILTHCGLRNGIFAVNSGCPHY